MSRFVSLEAAGPQEEEEDEEEIEFEEEHDKPEPPKNPRKQKKRLVVPDDDDDFGEINFDEDDEKQAPTPAEEVAQEFEIRDQCGVLFPALKALASSTNGIIVGRVTPQGLECFGSNNCLLLLRFPAGAASTFAYESLEPLYFAIDSKWMASKAAGHDCFALRVDNTRVTFDFWSNGRNISARSYQLINFDSQKREFDAVRKQFDLVDDRAPLQFSNVNVVINAIASLEKENVEWKITPGSQELQLTFSDNTFAVVNRAQFDNTFAHPEPYTNTFKHKFFKVLSEMKHRMHLELRVPQGQQKGMFFDLQVHQPMNNDKAMVSVQGFVPPQVAD